MYSLMGIGLLRTLYIAYKLPQKDPKVLLKLVVCAIILLIISAKVRVPSLLCRSALYVSSPWTISERLWRCSSSNLLHTLSSPLCSGHITPTLLHTTGIVLRVDAHPDPIHPGISCPACMPLAYGKTEGDLPDPLKEVSR